MEAFNKRLETCCSKVFNLVLDFLFFKFCFTARFFLKKTVGKLVITIHANAPPPRLEFGV